MPRHAFLLAVPMVLAATAAIGGPPDLEAERAALVRLDKAWAQAAAARDLEKVLSFWADDARVFPPGQPAVIGKEALRQYVSGSFALPGFSIRWETSDFTVSSSGAMAYGVGTNSVTMTGPEGKPITEQGRAVTVWRKDRTGEWKCVIDMWNAAPPAPSVPR
jgi:ketosteroid isomerase-like protein